MTDKELCQLQCKFAYYEELIIKRYSNHSDQVTKRQMIDKIDQWYFYLVDVQNDK